MERTKTEAQNEINKLRDRQIKTITLDTNDFLNGYDNHGNNGNNGNNGNEKGIYGGSGLNISMPSFCDSSTGSSYPSQFPSSHPSPHPSSSSSSYPSPSPQYPLLSPLIKTNPFQFTNINNNNNNNSSKNEKNEKMEKNDKNIFITNEGVHGQTDSSPSSVLYGRSPSVRFENSVYPSEEHSLCRGDSLEEGSSDYIEDSIGIFENKECSLGTLDDLINKNNSDPHFYFNNNNYHSYNTAPTSPTSTNPNASNFSNDENRFAPPNETDLQNSLNKFSVKNIFENDGNGKKMNDNLTMNYIALGQKILDKVGDSRRVVKRENHDVMIREELRGRRDFDISSVFWASKTVILIQKLVRGFLSRLRGLHRKQKGT